MNNSAVKQEKLIQISMFDKYELDEISIVDQVVSTSFSCTRDIKKEFKNYTLDKYKEDVSRYGLSNLWETICSESLKRHFTGFLNYNNFAELYEVGLALEDKSAKKDAGQYYTPADVSKVMSEWLRQIKADNICDVGCGTGNLILSYLEYVGSEAAKEHLKKGQIYLYDIDKTALTICKTILLLKYGLEYENLINCNDCDFLDSKIELPQNSKVISNPPYAKIKTVCSSWKKTSNILLSKELYAAFMEKIIKQSNGAVIITPYSFIGGEKFYELRRTMNMYSGFIVSFDNVPGNIFCGKKHGIFNTNTANSVRAAITVVNSVSQDKGFKVSPLIRFKNSERTKLLNSEYLVHFIPNERQCVDSKTKSYIKCQKELIDVKNKWIQKSGYRIKDLVLNDETEFCINVPNTCRYFTTGAVKKLNRTGMTSLYFKDEGAFNLAYCMINSSFCYWWWRMFDGGITYTKGLLMNMPIMNNLLTLEDEKFFADVVKEMVNSEKDFLVYKNNAGMMQENIKFPKEFRDKINQRLLNILDSKVKSSLFESIHSNSLFRE